MDPRIIEKGEIRLVGVVSYGGDIGELWKRFDANEGRIKHAVEGVWYELHVYPEDFTAGTPYYLVAREVTSVEAVPHDMFVKLLPPGEWASFTHRCGVEGYEVLNKRIESWLATAPYRHARNISLQVYDARFRGFSDPESELDLLIPIEAKAT
jgi:predicted transcriptional regulator YdeE